MADSTASTTAILKTIRSRLLTFTPGTGSTLATLVGTAAGAGADGRVYLNRAPDDITGLWVVLRLIDWDHRDDDGRFLHDGLCEFLAYGRPSPTVPAPQSGVELLADRAQEAWHRWATVVDGSLRSLPVESRFTVPYGDPADRDLAAVRLLLPFRCAPSFLTQYAA